MAGDLRRFRWTDEDGREWVSLVPQDAPDNEAWRFARVGPPPVAAALEASGWPRPAANAVQAGLIDAGILTDADMRRRGVSEQVDGIVRRAVRGSVQTVIDAFLLSSA